MSTLTVANLNDGSGDPAQSTLIGSARAWCKSRDAAGTPTIDNDFNVTSLTDNATGDLTQNFTDNFGNDDYVVNVAGRETAGVDNAVLGSLRGTFTIANAQTVSSSRFSTVDIVTDTPQDHELHTSMFSEDMA